MDLVLDKLRKLYDVLLMLECSDVKTEIISEDKIIKDTVENKTEDVAIDISDSLEIEDKTEYALEPESKADTIETVSDKYQNTQFINETLGEKTSKSDVSTKLQSRPIDNIKKAIGINDKFLYTKELFKSKPNIYNQTVDAIDNMENLSEVMKYLKSNFDWDFENDIVNNFIEIIKRKFPDE